MPDGPGTQWDRTGRAPQYRIPEVLHQGPHGCQPRTGPSRTWTTNIYAIGTTASADHRRIFHRPIIGTGPEQGHPQSIRRAPRPFGGSGPSSGSLRGSQRPSHTRPAGQRRRNATRRGSGPRAAARAAARCAEDSEAEDCLRTKRSIGHVLLSCHGL
jgi:hypothetical protein